MAAQLLPGLLSPAAGLVSDRVDRRRLMLAMDILRAVLLLNLLWVRSGAQVWVVYLAAFLISLAGRFFNPARSALVPLMIGREDLARGNGLLGASSSAAQLLGSGLGPGPETVALRALPHF